MVKLVHESKVSVVIPCYNHEKYVKEAIESVLSQTYSNIELIVIDDGSSDGSVAVIEESRQSYNFTFLKQENMGVCKTLNKGIVDLTGGEYIAILASDDYWHPKKIEKQICEIKKNKKSEFCYTQAVEFDSETRKEMRVFPRKILTGVVLKSMFLRQTYAAGSILFSRELFDKVSGFDEELKAEDWDFTIRCASITEFSAVSEPLFYYRSHDNNSMKTLGNRVIFEHKARVLTKNYLLVEPHIWILSILLHFFHDHINYKFKYLKKILQ